MSKEKISMKVAPNTKERESEIDKGKSSKLEHPDGMLALVSINAINSSHICGGQYLK